MSLNAVSKMKGIVAPLVGAWIESKKDYLPKWLTDVAPLVGAWIESVYGMCVQKCVKGRSSCRSVD